MDFHQNFYNIAMQKTAINKLHVHIIVTHNCFNTRKEAFKCRSDFQDVLCHRDYSVCSVARFAHQIQSKYYGGNRSVSIEGFDL